MKAERENAKQVAVRDRLHCEMRSRMAQGMVVECYHTDYVAESGVLLVLLVANFERMPTLETEIKIHAAIGPRGGIRNL